MVKIAIVGGAGNVGREVVDALLSRNKHEIIILSRKDAAQKEVAPGVKWFKSNYESVDELVKVFDGVHTVLSFISVPAGDTTAWPAQRNLIDAAVKAGVKRFAPSEWSSSKLDHLPWYDFKRETLANCGLQVIEYTLLQYGWFTNYMTYPYKSSKHITMFETPVNFNACRATLVDDGEALVTLTTVQDAAKVTALAIEYEGEWPLVGGVRGSYMTMNELVALGERIRGKPFTVEKLKTNDLLAGKVNTSWIPKMDHPSIPIEVREELAAFYWKGCLLAFGDSAFHVSDEWNTLLPDYKFTQPEEFLTEAWAKIGFGEKEVFQDY
ncbi:uncharacterized protein FIESC28_02864 [Fusarium coffeatum]|uniref:NmrA-like domain-containing protein n=1 Tax=Fusarium coffeatum TaxID=231269 RepID=A0A366S4Y2_9HYPO|nr:uncharacterized protein FIESC28_02864 [Fusarium coffeatum]RBR24374.1 hypothetical protein FIESC28_02864 [Fusarium coffeatum]